MFNCFFFHLKNLSAWLIQGCRVFKKIQHVFCMILRVNGDYFPNSNNLLVFVMETQHVFCEGETETLDTIWMIFQPQRDRDIMFC